MVTIESISTDEVLQSPNAAERSFLRRLWLGVIGRSQKRRSRLDLLELSDHQLRDIGISREEARHEAAKAHLFL